MEKTIFHAPIGFHEFSDEVWQQWSQLQQELRQPIDTKFIRSHTLGRRSISGYASGALIGRLQDVLSVVPGWSYTVEFQVLQKEEGKSKSGMAFEYNMSAKIIILYRLRPIHAVVGTGGNAAPNQWDACKGAQTDAMKRALMHLGIGLDAWALKDLEHETLVTDPEALIDRSTSKDPQWYVRQLTPAQHKFLSLEFDSLSEELANLCIARSAFFMQQGDTMESAVKKAKDKL